MTDTGGTVSALDAAESSFSILTESPGGLMLDGRTMHSDLPARRVGLRELRVLLAHPSMRVAVRNTVWAELLSRRDGPAWVVGATGIGMSPLRHIAGVLSTVAVDELADVEGEVLAGFLAALRAVDPSRPRVEERLVWGALRAGLNLVNGKSRARLPWGACLPVLAAVPPVPWGPGPRPMLVQAVRMGILSRFEHELLTLTRLDGQPLVEFDPDAAEEIAVSRDQAEGRLVEAILAGRLGPNGARR